MYTRDPNPSSSLSLFTSTQATARVGVVGGKNYLYFVTIIDFFSSVRKIWGWSTSSPRCFVTVQDSNVTLLLPLLLRENIYYFHLILICFPSNVVLCLNSFMCSHLQKCFVLHANWQKSFCDCMWYVWPVAYLLCSACPAFHLPTKLSLRTFIRDFEKLAVASCWQL